MSDKLFGTDGVRGVANQYPMTAEFALKLAMAAGEKVCTNKKKVAIARDTRISGEMLETAMASGFMAAGVDVLLLGVMPTPVLTAITSALEVDMAVMITASHNPYHDNGIKLIDAEGNKFSDKATAEIEQLIAKGEFSLNPDKIGTSSSMPDAVMLYVEKLYELVGDKEKPLAGLRVVLDCANGAFYKLMPEMFKQLGAGVIVIGNEPNGLNINKDCGSQHIEQMQKVVKEAHAQLGVACDGDGDRIIVCNEKGEKVSSEQVIAFIAQYMEANGTLQGRPVVSTILSNTGLDSFIASLGVEYFATKVGERYVIEKMQEVNGALGGEESGHVVLGDYSKTGDALVVSLVLSLGLLQSGKKMSEVFPVFKEDACAFKNLRFASNEQVKKIMADDKVLAEAEAAKSAIAGQGRVVFRASGTEPVVRIWVGGKDKALVEALAEKMVAAVNLSAAA